MADQESGLAQRLPQLVREGYRGFNVVAFREVFIAIRQVAGPVDLSRMCEQNANAVSAQSRTVNALRTGMVRVRTPAGTDISFRVGDRPFNKQDGDASAERMSAAKVQVDREVELPAGVLRVAPLEETANGVIVVPEARFGNQRTRGLRLKIVNGKVMLEGNRPTGELPGRLARGPLAQAR